LIHYPKNTEGGNKRKYMQFFEKPKWNYINNDFIIQVIQIETTNLLLNTN
jgi:hypothetical protein